MLAPRVRGATRRLARDAIHLHEQLCLHSTAGLVLTAIAMLSSEDTVDFIQEDRAWCVVSGQIKQSSDELLAVASVFRDERACADIEESRATLRRNCFGKHRLPRAGRPMQEDASPWAKETCEYRRKPEGVQSVRRAEEQAGGLSMSVCLSICLSICLSACVCVGGLT